ncbi:unnamed protein product [Soboliphyme baturini]|uniref:Avl9 domain-containing protein n=1 Tax=Soboliphyme baturini TaxID=241478 RepID=A0A183IYP1_9BILA|nr:unnamed protein product [Soboliphyme baturini]
MIENGLTECTSYCGQRTSKSNEGDDSDENAANNTDSSLLKEIEEALKMKSGEFHSLQATAGKFDTASTEPVNVEKGSFCHPYLSLAYLDWLESDSVRACVVGATNALFIQRKDLFDVIVVVEDNDVHMSIFDPELRRALSLTTADLRFTEFIVKNIYQTGNTLVDDTTWEGNDEWIRQQLREYLLALLLTAGKTGNVNHVLSAVNRSLTDSVKEEDFNSTFVETWKCTHNFKTWKAGNYRDCLEAQPRYFYIQCLICYQATKRLVWCFLNGICAFSGILVMAN